MGIIDKIRLFFKFNSIIGTEIKEAKKMVDNKPGWQKTEFWLKLVTVDLPVLWLSIKGLVPAKYAVLIEIGGVAVFGIINTVQKAVENWKAVKASQSTVTTTEPVTTVTTPAAVIKP